MEKDSKLHIMSDDGETVSVYTEENGYEKWCGGCVYRPLDEQRFTCTGFDANGKAVFCTRAGDVRSYLRPGETDDPSRCGVVGVLREMRNKKQETRF